MHFCAPLLFSALLMRPRSKDDHSLLCNVHITSSSARPHTQTAHIPRNSSSRLACLPCVHSKRGELYINRVKNTLSRAPRCGGETTPVTTRSRARCAKPKPSHTHLSFFSREIRPCVPHTLQAHERGRTVRSERSVFRAECGGVFDGMALAWWCGDLMVRAHASLARVRSDRERVCKSERVERVSCGN